MAKLISTFSPVFLLVLAFSAANPQLARATVFDLPAFIEEGEWSIGLEPEIALSEGTGAALNLKPRYGVSDLLDLEALIGMGSGARGFRTGLTADFEWFPDYGNQPGIATPFFFEYSRLNSNGLFVWGAKPMVYKTFHGQDAEYTPFFAFPIGWGLSNSVVNGYVQVALGSVFKLPNAERWRFTIEAGFEVSQSYSYISGGATFYFSDGQTSGAPDAHPSISPNSPAQ